MSVLIFKGTALICQDEYEHAHVVMCCRCCLDPQTLQTESGDFREIQSSLHRARTEHFIRMFVVVPWKHAFELHELDLLAIQLATTVRIFCLRPGSLRL